MSADDREREEPPSEKSKSGESERAASEPIPELPPNVPPGLLGEPGLNVTKIDTFEPNGMNAGLIQESTWETRWLGIALLYLLFFPAAFVVLWISKRISVRSKIVVTIVGVIGLALVAYALWH